MSRNHLTVTRSFALVSVLLLGGWRRPAAQTGTEGPRLLVVEKDAAMLALVNPESGAVLGRIPTGQGPHEVEVSTDGKLAFVSNYGSSQSPGHTISMIDLSSRKQRKQIDVAPLSRPHGVAFANGRLYFTAEANRKIARYDPSADRIDWQFETGQNVTHMVVLSRDGGTIFTSNIGSDNLSVIRQVPSQSARANEAPGNDERWTAEVIAVGKGPEGIDLAPDGKELWSAHSRDGGVSIIDAANRKVARQLSIGTKRSNRIKLTPDGRLALVTDLDGGELVVIDARARTILRRMPLGRQPEGLLIPPDGKRAFVAVNGDNHVAIVDLMSWQVTKRIPTGAGPDGMAWIR